MDFNKLSQEASGFMNKQNNSSNQGSADPNMNTNTNTNTGGTGNMGANTGNMSDQTGSNQGMAGTSTNTNTGSEDYGDKGLDFIEKKTGHTLSRDQNEKITDGARGMFEKMSGKKIDSKYSN